MSRVSSSILTIKCDVIGCEKEQVNVQLGQIVSTDADWGSVTINGERDVDLCPDHLQGLEDFIYGPDPDPIFNEDEDKQDVIDPATGAPWGEA